MWWMTQAGSLPGLCGCYRLRLWMTTLEQEESAEKGSKVRLLSRAYAVLRAINDHPDGLSLIEISHYVKLPIATVRRIAESLEAENFIISAPQSNLFRLGPTLALYGSNVRPFDIAQLARPMLTELAAKTNETVHLCVPTHGMAVVVDLIRGIYPLQTITTIGTSLPLFATASGKALLAAMSEKELKSLKNHMALSAFTRNTLPDWNDLIKEVNAIKEAGIAIDREEHQSGICGLAIPVKGPGGEACSIGMPISKVRFQARYEEFVEIFKALSVPWGSPR